MISYKPNHSNRKELELKHFYLTEKADVHENHKCAESFDKKRKFQAIQIHENQFYQLKCQLSTK